MGEDANLMEDSTKVNENDNDEDEDVHETINQHETSSKDGPSRDPKFISPSQSDYQRKDNGIIKGYGTIKDLSGSVFNPFSFLTSSEESSDDGNSTENPANQTNRLRNGKRASLVHSKVDASSRSKNGITKSNEESTINSTNPPATKRISTRTGPLNPTNKNTSGEANTARRNGNKQIREASPNGTKERLPKTTTKSVRSSSKTRRNTEAIIRKQPVNGKTKGKLKDPPLYSTGASRSSKRRNGGKDDNDCHDHDTSNTAGSSSSSSSSSSADENIARVPLHTATSTQEDHKEREVLSQKWTRDLDKCQTKKLHSRQSKTADTQSSPRIRKVDDSDDDSDGTENIENETSNEEQSIENKTTTTTTAPASTSSLNNDGVTAAERTPPPVATPSPLEPLLEEYNPFGDDDGSSISSRDTNERDDEMPKTSKVRTKDPQFSHSQQGEPPSPSEQLEEEEEEEYNPFGDSWGDSDSSDYDEQQKAQISQTKSKKRTREQRDSNDASITTTTTKPPPTKTSEQTKGTATEALDRNVMGLASTLVPQSNGIKCTRSLATAGNLKFVRRGGIEDDSATNGGMLVLLSLLTNQKHCILNAQQSKELDQWILKKAKYRAALEREVSNTNIEHWQIISNDARRVASLLVPTSEQDLVQQRIFSEAERRLYGTFVIRTIQEFLKNHEISIDEINHRRQSYMESEAKNTEGLGDGQTSPESGQSGWCDLESQLLEHGYCAEWIDKDGKKLCVFGTVTEYVPTHANDDDEDKEKKGEYLTIEYAEQSRSLLNNNHTQIKNLSILDIQPVNIARAWGGCLLYQEKQGRMQAVNDGSSIPLPIYSPIPNCQETIQRAPFPLCWRVPDLYTRATIWQKSAPNMPCLCLQYSGFQLEFTVRPSTIPNSGNGVFLSITSLLHPPLCTATTTTTTTASISGIQHHKKNLPVFSLAPGEVLDIGVYAPLTSQDETPDYIMLVRSFLQSFWCDSYSMNSRSNEAVFDITHGRGELIPEAKQSILPFVNERNDWETNRAEIELMEDPQGAFHYVLGYRCDDNDNNDDDENDSDTNDAHDLPFRQLADGEPREVFVDYGAQYEMVRLHQGYPRIPMTEEERKQKLDEDEREKLDLMFEFSAKKLQKVICYLHDFVRNTMETLEKRQNRNNNIRERALAAIIVLQARSEQLRPEVVVGSHHHHSPMDHDEINNNRRENRLRQRKEHVCYNLSKTNYDVDDIMDDMTKEDWDTVDSQLQSIVETILPGSSLALLLSSLPQQAAINDGSLLGMACSIVASQVRKSSDDLLESEYIEF
ncbi:unnamed protein product [Cylindrotheca closterium]|uniref:Uncharacterized protein n=1 Tax=Cylindrotheca closterium TaxID=2856 RepID=A0AAD2FMK0_9STRA|nr:unnamed protein product [Cylindrotheca closterium]